MSGIEMLHFSVRFIRFDASFLKTQYTGAPWGKCLASTKFQRSFVISYSCCLCEIFEFSFKIFWKIGSLVLKSIKSCICSLHFLYPTIQVLFQKSSKISSEMPLTIIWIFQAIIFTFLKVSSTALGFCLIHKISSIFHQTQFSIQWRVLSGGSSSICLYAATQFVICHFKRYGILVNNLKKSNQDLIFLIIYYHTSKFGAIFWSFVIKKYNNSTIIFYVYILWQI